MNDAASYIISAYSFIFNQPFEKILNTGYQSKDGNPIPSFDEDLLIKLCSDAQFVFEKEENVLKINGDLIIVGDIHGSLHDLLRILYFIIKDQNKKVLFLGDYVDRGNFSLECVTILFAFKIMYPERFYLIRGNHEFETMCSQYGFKKEIMNYHNPKRNGIIEVKFADFLKKYYEEQKEIQCDEYYANHNDVNCYKYSEKLYESFLNVFSYLPICCIVNDNTFCVHGGISPRLKHIDTLNKAIVRPINKYEDNRLFADILWSDPSNSVSCLFGENPRGHGYLFNTNAVDLFLVTNKLKRIIRGHQCIQNGTDSQFNDKCITVFSASSYGSEMENNSGILQIYKNDKIEYITFTPLKRLQKIDAFYYKVQNLNLNKIKTNQSCFSIKHPNLTTNISTRIRQFRGIKPNRSCMALSRLSKMMFITNSRKSNAFVIKKPIVSNSSSMENLSFEDENINYTNSNKEEINPNENRICS